MTDLLIASLESLLDYVEFRRWSGYDIYDIFNSKILSNLNIQNRAYQIILTQLGKRSPLNFRSLLGVEKGHNPKGLGLFLSGYTNLYRKDRSDKTKTKIETITKLLRKYRSPGYRDFCWGYNWDYRTRAAFLPKHTPQVVATTFIANGFLDAYETFGSDEYLKIARGCCNFILNDLNKTYENDTFCWSYSSLDRTQIYNATMLGAKLLARVYSFTDETELLDEAERTIRFVVNHQNDDGSWVYGALPYHQWIDSFHTGYNLECLYDFMKYSGIDRYRENFEKGLHFYRRNFFLDDFTPKYYHEKLHPIDIHSAAQAVICFAKFGDADFAKEIALWTIKNMQDPTGYFYYQKHRFYKNKVSYMRWGQAWMMYALSTVISA